MQCACRVTIRGVEQGRFHKTLSFIGALEHRLGIRWKRDAQLLRSLEIVASTVQRGVGSAMSDNTATSTHGNRVSTHTQLQQWQASHFILVWNWASNVAISSIMSGACISEDVRVLPPTIARVSITPSVAL